MRRLGARFGNTFVDGGIHPRFGTHNFTLPLQNGHYLEVICPLDHPSSDPTSFGKQFHDVLSKVVVGLYGLLQAMSHA